MTVSTGPLSDQRPYFFAHFWGWCRSSSEKNIENFLFLTWQQEAKNAYRPVKAVWKWSWRNSQLGWHSRAIRSPVTTAAAIMWAALPLTPKLSANTKVKSMKELPVLYKRKEECCGCTACYSICPKAAISMVEDGEGFEYPQIDESKCIFCYQCLKVCPFKIEKEAYCFADRKNSHGQPG